VESTAAAVHFFWTTDGGVEHLGSFGGWSAQALDVNEGGQVAGSRVTTLPPPIAYQAFSWSRSHGKVDLPGLDGAESHALDLNNVGQIANGTGYSFTVTATNAAGTGPASAATNTVVPADVERPHPEPPAEQPRPDVPDFVTPPGPRPKQPSH